MHKKAVLGVLQPGILTSLQDNGRQAASHLGISQSGFADPHSAHWANRLVENSPDACLLEIAVGGVSALALSDCTLALCGAAMPLQINAKSKANWRSHHVRKGDLIEIGMAESGLRAYLSLRGGIVAVPAFGSCSTNVREKLGGLEGHGDAVKADDVIYAQIRPGLPADLMAPPSVITGFPSLLNLRFVQGYQYHEFAVTQTQRLALHEFAVSQRIDRMGVQLTGHKVNAPAVKMRSEGICYGAIQVPADGCPIVLLNDRQTIGGYPKLGSLLSIDAYRLAQAQPGTKVTLARVSIEQAQNILHLQYSKNKQLQPEVC